MNEKLRDFKLYLLNTGLFKKVSKNNNWYRVKECPYCGDTKWHLYVNIDLNSDSPVGYNCFKSNCKGWLNKQFLDYYNLEWNGSIPRGKRNNRINVDSKDFSIGELFKYEGHEEYLEMYIDYIFKRVGVRPTIDELKSFCIISEPNVYAEYMLNSKELNMVNMCWFVCSNGMLAGRSTIKKKDGWEKFTGNTNITDRAIYTIKQSFDLLSEINVCICEGIMDAIGLYYHGNINNGIFISVLGKDYMAGIKYVLNKGIFGDSVNIRIYKDADVKYVNIDNVYKRFFKSVSIYMNTLSKDFGVTADEIEIEKVM